MKSKQTNNKRPNEATHIYAVILAGGVGSRFWPLSRELEAKQFLMLNGDKSLLQQTIERISPLVNPENIFLIGNHQHRFQLEKHATDKNIPIENIVLEPEGKNTAPAIGFMAHCINAKDKNAVMMVLPADHFIRDEQRFLTLLENAIRCVAKRSLPAGDTTVRSEAKPPRKGHDAPQTLVTLGITPAMPHTGYGYIKIQSQVNKRTSEQVKTRKTQYARRNTHDVLKVEKFVEKPDQKKAEQYFKSKEYYWNSGIFIWKTDTIIKEIKQYLPQLYNSLQGLGTNTTINKELWSKITPISIDYGILEKSKKVALIAAKDIGWSDLGSWSSMHQIIQPDSDGNIIKGDSIDLGSKNITVFSHNRLVATVGLKDVVVVDTEDALLVCDSRQTEKVKQVVDKIKQAGRQEHYAHKTVKRPWGAYTVLNIGNGFKVKSIQIEPHKKLSLQKHNYRSEHWVVVEGQAKVTRGKDVYYPRENESIYIQKGDTHRLENPIDKPLRIVEVQCGHYLEEDDIERLEDDYQRNVK